MTDEATVIDGAPATPDTQVVRITQLAGDTVTLDFEEDLTVGEYLTQANIELGQGEVVTVNGAPANMDSTVEPGSVVVVAGKVANG